MFILIGVCFLICVADSCCEQVIPPVAEKTNLKNGGWGGGGGVHINPRKRERGMTRLTLKRCRNVKIDTEP